MLSGDATNADAIAAGFPPDVRGWIRVRGESCANMPVGASFECPPARSYKVIILERLKANGGFETLDTAVLGPIDAPIFHALAASVMTVQLDCSLPDEAILNGMPSRQFCQEQLYNNDGWAFNQMIEGYADMAGVTYMNGESDFSRLCYSNGTCEPITVVIGFQADEASRVLPRKIGMTMTGGIFSYEHW